MFRKGFLEVEEAGTTPTVGQGEKPGLRDAEKSAVCQMHWRKQIVVGTELLAHGSKESIPSKCMEVGYIMFITF